MKNMLDDFTANEHTIYHYIIYKAKAMDVIFLTLDTKITKENEIKKLVK